MSTSSNDNHTGGQVGWPTPDQILIALYDARGDRSLSAGWRGIPGVLCSISEHVNSVLAYDQVLSLFHVERPRLLPGETDAAKAMRWASVALRVSDIEGSLVARWAEAVCGYAWLAHHALQTLANGQAPNPATGALPGFDGTVPLDPMTGGPVAPEPAVPETFQQLPLLAVAMRRVNDFHQVHAEFHERWACQEEHDPGAFCSGEHVAEHELAAYEAMDDALPNWIDIVRDYADAITATLVTDLRPRLRASFEVAP